MTSLAGRRVVLGVTGGIAAYKAIEVCRRLIDAGAHVVPVMTKGAERFVGRTTLSALASEPVRTSLWDDADPIPHTRLGQSADVVLVAPATARVLGAYAAGISNDLLTATLLATRAPVLVCPAMHTEMWEHPAVQENLATLRRRGVVVVEPESGRLAGGDVGAGRLAVARAHRGRGRARAGPAATWPACRCVVTAGGTREAIDAVRVLTNRSSGKQGYAIAAEAAGRGAEVTLVTTVDRPAPPGVAVVDVESAAEMEDAVLRLGATADVVVMAAAVADFRPKAAVRGQAEEGRRAARDHPRAHHRHPGCAGREQATGSDPGRLRGRDERRRGQRHVEAASQAPRSHRGQRRVGARRRLRARHQRGRHLHRDRRPPAGPAVRQAGRGPRRARRCRRRRGTHTITDQEHT